MSDEVEINKNDSLITQFDILKQEQLGTLKTQIISGESKKQFVVFNNEAALGKTLTMVGAITEICKDPSKKVLCVLRFKQPKLIRSHGYYGMMTSTKGMTKKKAEKDIGLHKKINIAFGSDIAISIDADNYNKLKSKISTYPVIVITHQRYKELCRESNRSQRECFTKGRTHLIIDEEIHLVDKLVYDKTRIKEIIGLIDDWQYHTFYKECINPIDNFLSITNKSYKGFYYMCKDISDKKAISVKIDKFKSTISGAIQGKHINVQGSQRKKLLNEAAFIEEFYCLSLTKMYKS